MIEKKDFNIFTEIQICCEILKSLHTGQILDSFNFGKRNCMTFNLWTTNITKTHANMIFNFWTIKAPEQEQNDLHWNLIDLKAYK